ncbi:MAG: patatin-like phospholipase family protein [Janthinobacterium lividum]
MKATWEPLSERYATVRPRKLLALDGGGIRGVITLKILGELEQQLRHAVGDDKPEFRLCQYFDYIAGTSTGAIIATGLALGMSVAELLDFYLQKGKDMFDKAFLLKQWKSFYESGPLLDMLKETFGADTTLDLREGKLKCLLLIVTMNRSTDSPWPISNNPFAKYNQAERADCNLQIKLHQLVRASAAAPIYFPPETLQWDEHDPNKTFVFVDGGTTPYNNPSFLLYRMATQPAYELNWPIGEGQLLLVSVGTGSAPSGGNYANLYDTGKKLPGDLMYTINVDQDINCRTVGRCSYGAPIDRELHDMIPMDEEGHVENLAQETQRHFRYIRYNADLSAQGLKQYNLSHIKSKDVQELDSIRYLNELSQVGEAAAHQVSIKHLGHFAEKPTK